MKFQIKLLLLPLFILFFVFYKSPYAFANSYSLSGYVKDSSGNTILGASVDIYSQGTSNDVVPSTTTDQSGNYSFENIPQGVYDVKITPPSGSSFSSAIAVNQNISNNTTLNFILTPEGTEIVTGHLYDGRGNPVSNQVITFGSGSSQVSTITDSSGVYSAQVSSGTEGFNIRSTNTDPSLALPQSFNISADYLFTQDTILDITIPAKQVSIHVQDANGNPISNATIKANGTGNNGHLSLGDGITNAYGLNVLYGYTGATPTTDTSGNVTLWLLPDDGFDLYTISATPPSGSNYQITTLSNLNITDTTTETIILQQPVTITGHLYDGQGNPVPNQVITFGSGSSRATATTDSTGAYSVQTPSGTEGFNIRSTNTDLSLALPQSFNISDDYIFTQNTSLDITIPAKQVSIHVQDLNGDPVSNATIKASGTGNNGHLSLGDGITNAYGLNISYGYTGTAPTTDTSGDITLWLLPDDGFDLYTISATPPSGSNYNQFILNNIHVVDNQTDIIVLQYNHATPTTTVTLSPSPFSDGLYSDPTTVTLSATAASGYSVANTYYTIDGGSQQIYSAPFTVTGAGSHAITYWSVDNSGVTEATNSKSFTITEAYSLSGTVYNDADKNGVKGSGEQGVAGVTVTLNTGQSTTTDSNGNYTFSNLESGTYTETLTVPSGYITTTTNPVSVPLSANTTENFGIALTGPVTLASIADTYLVNGSKNNNEGSSPMLTIQNSGNKRALVEFDESQIQQAVGGSTNYTATLQFTLTGTADLGTTGRQIDLDRMLQPWSEGNGYIIGNTTPNHGTGSGATWNCASDSDISNTRTDCSGSTAWDMTDVGSFPFVTTPTATAIINKNQTGTVSFDVTSDVQSFLNGTNTNDGWIIKLDNEDASGKVQFGSKESSTPPQLIITQH